MNVRSHEPKRGAFVALAIMWMTLAACGGANGSTPNPPVDAMVADAAPDAASPAGVECMGTIAACSEQEYCAAPGCQGCAYRQDTCTGLTSNDCVARFDCAWVGGTVCKTVSGFPAGQCEGLSAALCGSPYPCILELGSGPCQSALTPSVDCELATSTVDCVARQCVTTACSGTPTRTCEQLTRGECANVTGCTPVSQ